MEGLIEELTEELEEITEGKTLKQKRRELGDKVDIRFCRMIIFSLLWASVGYQSALRFAGMKLGKNVGGRCKKGELGLVLEGIKKIIEDLGGGKVEVEILPASKTAQVRVFEGALACGVSNVLQNLCFFQEGFIEGYLDGVISRAGSLTIAGSEKAVQGASVQERRCIGFGDEYCEFLITF